MRAPAMEPSALSEPLTAIVVIIISGGNEVSIPTDPLKEVGFDAAEGRAGTSPGQR